MSPAIVHDPAAISEQPANGIPAKENELAPEVRDALIARAKDIIAGRVIPGPMVVPQKVKNFMEQHFTGFEPPPTAESIRFFTEHACLQEKYKGESIVVFKMPDSSLAVLGSGELEIVALLQGLSDSERPKVWVQDTE